MDETMNEFSAQSHPSLNDLTGLSGKRLLIVEDDSLFLGSLAKILRLEGASVDEAEGGWEALTLLVNEKYDLILSDIHMPGMSGIELLSRVKARGTVPMLLMTGEPDYLKNRTGPSLACAGFIQKPMKREDLFSSLTQCLSAVSPALPTLAPMLWFNVSWSAWYIAWAIFLHISPVVLPTGWAAAVLGGPVLVRAVHYWLQRRRSTRELAAATQAR
jgi:CheY-like chemotaxis protein